MKGYKYDPVISHGICPECKEAVLAAELEVEKELKENPPPMEVIAACRALTGIMERDLTLLRKGFHLSQDFDGRVGGQASTDLH